MADLNGYHGISKEEAVEKLNGMGIPAIWDNGVVQIALEHNGEKHTVKEMEEVLKKIDYRMSHGFSHRLNQTQAPI